MANPRKGLGRGLSSLVNGENYQDQLEKPSEPNSFSKQIESKIEQEADLLVRKTKKADNSFNDNAKKTPKGVEVLEIEVEKIHPNPNQPRSNFDKQELEQLSASIKQNGLLQPISVTAQQDDSYEIIAGERRWRASKQAGLKTIPVLIKDVDDDKKLELALIENLQRSDLNPIEEAYCYKKILEDQGINQNELAAKVSKSRSTVTNSLRLLSLPEKAQKYLYDNKLTAGHARAILSVSNSESQEKLTEKIINEKLSVREAESMANLYSGRTRKALTTRKPSAPKSYKRVAKALSDYFGNKVRVKRTKNANKIEIEFKDERELERIFTTIMPEED